MLRYVRKFYILYYVLAYLPPLILVGILSYIGQTSQISMWSWLLVMASIFICMYASSQIANRAATIHVEKIMKLFNEACDPQAFLDQGREIASRIKAPFGEWGSWYLSPYSVAYIETGQYTEASGIIDAMRASAQKAMKPEDAARICLNMHAPIKRLYGAELAVKCIDEAEALLVNLPETSAVISCRSFIAWERKIQAAEAGPDYDEIATLNGSIHRNGQQLMRIRVMAALREAKALRELGNRPQELDCLHFIIDNGNKLQAVDYATSRLSEIIS